MRITDIRVDTLSIGPSIVRVETDEGLVGLSEVGWHDPALFRRYLDLTVKPLLVGTDPLQPGRHWERLVFGTHERPYPTPIELVGVIDIALWDLAGKAAALPLYALLGGAARTEFDMYWSCGAGGNRTPSEMADAIEAGVKAGFAAFKIRMDWGPLRIDADPRKDMDMARAVRELVGPDAWIGFDANRGYSVGTAIRQGRILEEIGYAHFEEPLPSYDLPGLREVADALDIPISSGENEQGRWRFRDLIAIGDPDILQPDIADAGGVSETVRIFQLAEVHGKPVMPHSPGAGIAAVASLHAYATVPGGTRPHEYSIEYGPPPEQIAALFEDPIVPSDGRIALSDRPGLGLTLDERVIDRLRVTD
jgi:L-alanine-DL-glutamate epimerase-like enolase superfamily enzyme